MSLLEKGARIKALQTKLNLLNEATANEVKVGPKMQKQSIDTILADFVTPGSFFEITKDPVKSLAFLMKTGVFQNKLPCRSCGKD
jgi:hypothetical protein